jgi:hypothetical protein
MIAASSFATIAVLRTRFPESRKKLLPQDRGSQGVAEPRAIFRPGFLSSFFELAAHCAVSLAIAHALLA